MISMSTSPRVRMCFTLLPRRFWSIALLPRQRQTRKFQLLRWIDFAVSIVNDYNQFVKTLLDEKSRISKIDKKYAVFCFWLRPVDTINGNRLQKSGTN